MTGYQTRSITFSYPALTAYNWNYLDHLISGYQDQMTDALRFWRIRFLLIPLEAAPSTSATSSSSLLSEKLDEEEERLAGFSKFIEMIERARFVNNEEKQRQKKQNALDIQLTTLNLSSLVKREDMHPLLPEAFMDSVKTAMPAKIEYLTKKSPIDVIAKALTQPPPNGLSVQDRHWHLKIYENVVTGEEIVDWIIQNFSDIETREQAIQIGNILIEEHVLEHVKQKHKMLDGFYFYQFCPKWTKSAETISSGRNNQRSNKRFQAVKQIAINMVFDHNVGSTEKIIASGNRSIAL